MEFTIAEVSKKEATFNIDILQKYQYLELISSLGFFWGKNKIRPYINGHEREDVVKKRDEFVKYFMDNKNTHRIYMKKEYTVMN